MAIDRCASCRNYSNPGRLIGACWANRTGTNIAGHGIFRKVENHDTCDQWSKADGQR